MERLVLGELIGQVQESQTEILAVIDILTLLIARLAAVGVIDKGFLEDMIVCADGVDAGRN